MKFLRLSAVGLAAWLFTACSFTVAVTGVSLDKTTVSVETGASVTLVATVAPTDATTRAVAWSTSDASVATVSEGTVTGVAAGSAVISVTTLDGAKAATCTVKVTAKDLVINEVVNAYYVNYSVAVELYNPTAQTVDLADYSLRTHSVLNDGSTYASGGVRAFALPSLRIAPGAYVAVRAKVSPHLESGGQTIYLDDGAAIPYFPFFGASNDFVELTKSGTTVDFLRWGAMLNAPTSADFGFASVASNMPSDPAGIGYALARDINSTNTKAASDWTLRAWSTLGGKNDTTSDTDGDGDGLPDCAEVPGSTFAGLPLYDWGARVGQKDIFIHIDYMESPDPGVIPQKAALDKVVAAFAADPNGPIHIHFDVGNLYSATLDPAKYNLDGLGHKVAYSASITMGKATGYGNVYQYKAANMPVAKSKAFFYMLFANSQKADGTGGSSGVANQPGNTAIISLGGWGLTTAAANGLTAAQNTNQLVNYHAATVMHEFGHNLGLYHGGDVEENYKPNYFSVMNYLYQLSGLPALGNEDTRFYYAYRQSMGAYHAATNPMGLATAYLSKADQTTWVDGPITSSFAFSYSNGSGTPIDESAAVETAGIGRTASAGIDFNMNGSVSGTVGADIRYSLNPDYTVVPNRTVLRDFNDWNAVNAVFQRGPMGTFAGASRSEATRSSNSMAVIFNNPDPVNSAPCATNPALRSPRGPR